MRHTGQPQYTMPSYEISSATGVDADTALSDSYVDGKGNVYAINSQSSEIIKSQIQKLNTMSPDKNTNGVLANGVKKFVQDTTVNKGYVDITNFTYNNKKTTWISLSIPDTDGDLYISKITLKGYKVYLESSSDDDSGITKQDLVNLYTSINGNTYTNDYVEVGNEKRNIIREAFSTEASLVDSNFNNLDHISLEAGKLPILPLTFDLPKGIGESYDNMLYVIDEVQIEGKFKGDNTFNVKKSVKLDKKLSFIHATKTAYFARSSLYKGDFARGFYATDNALQIKGLPIVDSLKNPKYIFSLMELFKAHGISSFYYNYSQLVKLSVFDNNKDSFKMPLVFSGYEWEPDSNDFNSGVKATIKYDDGNSIVSTQKTYNLSSDILKVDFDNGNDKTYAAKIELPNQPSYYKDTYLVIEKQKVSLMFLSTKQIPSVDVFYPFIRSGSTENYLPAAQLVQQLFYSMTQFFAWTGWDQLLLTAPFMIYTGVGAVLLYNVLFWFSWAVISSVFNMISGEGLDRANTMYMYSVFLTNSLLDSFLGRERKAKSSFNNTIFNRGNFGKVIQKTVRVYEYVPTIYSEVPVSLNEIGRPHIPFTANLRDYSPSDLFDTDKNILLTDELKEWARTVIDRMLSYNYVTPLAYESGPIYRASGETTRTKSFYKSYMLATKKDGFTHNPLIDQANNKVLGVVPLIDLYRGEKTLKDAIDEFYDKVQASATGKNEFAKFLASHLKNVKESLNKLQENTFNISSIRYDADNVDKDVRYTIDLFHGSFFSTPILYDEDENKLKKHTTVPFSIPSPGGEEGSKKIASKNGVYYVTDAKLKEVTSLEDYFNNSQDFIAYQPLIKY